MTTSDAKGTLQQSINPNVSMKEHFIEQIAEKSQPQIEEAILYVMTGQLLRKQCRENGLQNLMSRFACLGGKPILFAGAVRDALYSVYTDTPIQPRDYDVGIARMTRHRFKSLNKKLGGERNRYGGYQYRDLNGLNVDIWRIEDTVGISVHRCNATISNVLKTFVLDVNAIAFDPMEDRFYDEGCLRSFLDHEISFVQGALLHDHYNFAARALSLSYRFQFQLSSKLCQFTTEWFDQRECTRQELKLRNFYSTSSKESARPSIAEVDDSEPAPACFA